MATNKDDSLHLPSTVSTPGQAGGFVVWIKGPSGPATTAAASALVEALAPTHRTALLEATDAQQALWPGCDMGLVDRSLHYIACLVARRGIACVVTAGSDPDLGGQTQHPAEVSGIQWLTLWLETGSRSPLTPDPDAHSGATVGGDSLRPSNGAQLSAHHETPDLSVCLETETPHTWIPRVLSLLTARRLWIPPCTPRQQRQQAPALPSVVVVQDWAQPPSQQLIRRTFGWRDSVSCVSATADTLPPAPHYVFDLDTFDSESRARALKAQHDGAKVTVVVKHVAPATAHFLSGTTWNVLPAYGDTEHIGYGTLRRAMRMACDGVPVVARGFLANSSDGFTGETTVAPSYFVDLLGRMSRIARDGDAVVAAVVAPHRTGSQWLRDLLGWTVGSDVRVVHEHYIPSAGPMWSESWNLAEAVAREPDPEKQRLLRRAALRSAIQTAKRRYIFVTYRDPIDRVISYFIKRHSRFLRERLDPSTQMYLAPSEIQDAFDQWLPGHVRSHSRWFRTTLFDHFGLDVCDATPTEDGLLVAHSAPNTLVVVPTETLSKLEAAVEAAYGADTCAPLASDSALARGDGPITTAFRRQIHMHPAVATALRSVREAAYIRAHVSATTLG